MMMKVEKEFPMSDYPPKGKELQLAKEVNRLMEKYKHIDCDSDPHSALISIDHALDGVRVNGTERVVSLVEVRKYLKEYKGECEQSVKSMRDSLDLTCVILSKMENMKICPACKGSQGKKGVDAYRTPWEDCTNCRGRGII